MSDTRFNTMATGDGTARMMRYDANKKSAGLAYLIWFFLGMLGVHRFYLGFTWTGVAILALTLLGFVTMGLSLIVSGLWAFVDLFLIPGMAREHNNNLIATLT